MQPDVYRCYTSTSMLKHKLQSHFHFVKSKIIYITLEDYSSIPTE